MGRSRKTGLRGIRLRRAALLGPPCAAFVLLIASHAIGFQQVAPDAPPLSVDAAKALKSPVPVTPESIGRGKRLYTTHGCANCHGNDGKALVEVVANATDLTDPSVWKNGTDEGLVFRSIRDGAGLAMPPFKAEVTAPEDLWHLVNFVRSLWPDDKRPPIAKH